MSNKRKPRMENGRVVCFANKTHKVALPGPGRWWECLECPARVRAIYGR